MNANQIMMLISGILAFFISIGIYSNANVPSFFGIIATSVLLFAYLYGCFWIYYKIWKWLTKDIKSKDKKENNQKKTEKYSYKSGNVSYKLLYNSNLPQNIANRFYSFHIETTGLDYQADRIVEVAAVLFEDGKPVKHFSSLINSDVPIPDNVSRINKITNEMLQAAPSEEQVFWDLVQFLEDGLSGNTPLAAYKATFAMRFLQNALNRTGYTGNIQCIDVFSFAKDFLDIENHKMKTVADHLSLSANNDRRALADADLCGRIFIKLLDYKEEDYSWANFYQNYRTKSLSDMMTHFYQMYNWGPGDQVLEVLDYFSSKDKDVTNEMLQALIDERYSFTADQILKMGQYPSGAVAELIVNAKPFRPNHLKKLKHMLGDDFDKIKNNVKIAPIEYKGYQSNANPVVSDDFVDFSLLGEEPSNGLSDFITGAAIGMMLNESPKKHSHKCDGDCANCPPHYGYYYNRYFLGKGHTSGCERGGNGGRGTL